MLSILSALGVGMATAAPDWPGFVPKGEWARSTRELAADLLPPTMADDAVSHALGIPITQNGVPSSLRFQGRARPSHDGFCVRRHYYVTVYWRNEGKAEPQPPVEGWDIRLGPCDSDGLFAHVNPGAELDGAKRALRWLEWAQTVARSHSSLPFRIFCASETEVDRCAEGARKALADIPLHKTFIVSKSWPKGRHQWQMAITETTPGQLLWDVKIDASPDASLVDLKWKIPSPF